MTLAEAQIAKMRHIAAKLLLEPGQRVLDIGCGWGGLGIFLAKHCGVEVVGVTLSKEQHEVATQRAKEAGVDKQVTFKLQDYRLETGSYDRIVSVGMFEHVGVKHYREFFGSVERLLKPTGVALVHAIGRRDGPGFTNPWLRKYIFPGGYSPALSEVVPVVEKTRLVDHRHRDPAPALCRDAARLARELQPAPRRDRRASMTSASAGCGSSI